MWDELYSGIKVVSRPARYATFSRPLLSLLLRHRQLCKDASEAGGILLGSLRGSNFDVRFGTVPFPGDLRSRNRFVRRDSLHIAFFKRISAASQNRITYLGEWHTHPVPNPIPSSLDRSEWLQVHRQLKGPFLALIIGMNSFYIESIG